MASLSNRDDNQRVLAAFAAPRYSTISFPDYRFIPGQNPRPIAETPGPSAALVSPQAWINSPEYLYGCDLYNHAYWWEAHEAWEGLWRLAGKGGVQGRFLQGLIQASACHLKRFVGHVKGVERLRRSSLGYLRMILEDMDGESYMGLDLVAFVKHFETYYRGCDSPSETRNEHDPRRYPYLCLRVSS